MRPVVIPQIKKPTMTYGLGVSSHLMKYERELSSKGTELNMKDSDTQKLLENNSLLSGLAIETEILNKSSFAEFTVSDDEKNIEIDEGSSAIVTAIGKSNIIISIKGSQGAGKASVIIINVIDNSEAGIKIIYENNNGNGKAGSAIQQNSVENEGISLIKIAIGDNSNVILNELFITNEDSFRHSSIALKGRGSAVYPSHAFFTYGKARVDFKSEVTHYGENSESDMKVKGIINEGSQVITQGHVTIKPSAYGSNGYQQEDLILVGEKSVARPIPNLEIGNNEVKCSHGATVSSIDEETLFYLQSRGIRKHDAISLMLSSFLTPIMGLFSDGERQHNKNKQKQKIEESGEIETLT